MSDTKSKTKPVRPEESPGPPADHANASIMEDRARPRRMLNERQVLEIVPVSSTTLWRMENGGLFPKGSYISPNRKIWYEDEIVQWQNSVNGRSRGRRPRRKS
ncbi:helix-turn-helix transcriptional regulator [Bradyrhizobium sp. SZCCHNR3003]|uniref:helix-turn-helix transcriptional regulator n=1 Tax=Bradyrhizobium sp. SZCCHNR3003 TaxID=3057387 RepID=UPI002916875B|nr:AlpA family phage regulatory protein [Bradyrhizobium sp. SZCCHNR3003]